jgi:hypothetical protein
MCCVHKDMFATLSVKAYIPTNPRGRSNFFAVLFRLEDRYEFLTVHNLHMGVQGHFRKLFPLCVNLK